MAKKSEVERALPGVRVRVEVAGRIGRSSWWDLVPGSEYFPGKQVSVGITDDELAIVEAPLIHEPGPVRRIPIGRVKLLEFKEGLMEDQVVLDLGEAKPVRMRFSPAQRERTEVLVSILSGDERQHE